jgi:alkylhydroperoxidase family enzyme
MRLQEVAWEPALVEPRRDPGLERRVRRELGRVPGFVPYLAACPWLVHALLDGTLFQARLLHLELELGELAFLVVSHDNSCRYCYAETRTMLRVLGLPPQRIERMEQGLSGPEIAPREQGALALARRFSRANPLPSAADLDALERAGLAREALLELLFAAATAVVANRVATIPALPPEHVERREPLARRLLRPFLERALRARHRRARPERLAPEQKSAPFGETVARFDGLPAGPALRRILDACWSAPGLPPATRALVFAVVARGLGAAAAEREARRLAASAGVGAGAFEDALRHLAAPDAAPAGEQVLAFARETIWYEPARLQRRARPLRDALGPERFLDLVGTVSVANAICRLSAVLDAA